MADRADFAAVIVAHQYSHSRQSASAVHTADANTTTAAPQAALFSAVTATTLKRTRPTGCSKRPTRTRAYAASSSKSSSSAGSSTGNSAESSQSTSLMY